MHSDWLKKHSKSTDHVLVFKTKVSHFRVKNTPLKSSNEGSVFFFLWTKEKLLFTKSSFKECNYGLFTAERKNVPCFELQSRQPRF